MQPIGYLNMRTGVEGQEPTKTPLAPPNKSEWAEIPAAVYLSWSRARQLDYCIRRDLAAAEESIKFNKGAESVVSDWYMSRAAGYKEELNALLKEEARAKSTP